MVNMGKEEEKRELDGIPEEEFGMWEPGGGLVKCETCGEAFCKGHAPLKVSEEYIEAMNGVLNGEKWRREDWEWYIEADNFEDDGDRYAGQGAIIKMYKGEAEDATWTIFQDDFLATDWVKVND